MQNYCKTIGAMAAASALAAGNATAIEIDYEISAGYTSEYLFRGFNLGQDLVDVGLAGSTEINGFGLSAGAWYGSFAAPTGVGIGALRNANANELNLFTEVGYDLGFADAAIGYIYYYYQQGKANNALLGTAKDDQEVYFSLSRDFGLVNVSLTHYWLVSGNDNDGYTDLTVSNSTELNSCLSLESGVTFGYQVEKGKLGHITAQVGLDYALTETATVTPFVAHSWSTSENGIYAGTENEFVAGARVAVSF